MNIKHKWIALAAGTTGKKYALDRLMQDYEAVPDSDPRLYVPAVQELIKSLENPPLPDVRIICYPDPEYPEKLKNLAEPPAQLYIRGDIAALTSGIVAAVVGSRDASAYGLSVTMDFCRDLCETGITVISGGARGVDSAAAETMLKFGGRTVAVLGSGIDVVYPSENRAMFEKIVKSGGALISEYPFGTRPIPAYFPRRNRIIAALADCCIITEAGLRSGSLITANLAADLRRPLFAVPGNITSRGSAGTNHLIKTGAALAESGLQVAAELKVMLSFSEAHSAPQTGPEVKKSIFSRLSPSAAPENPPEPKTAPVKTKLPDNLTDIERAVIEAINNGRTSATDIASATGTDEVILAPELIMMELKGLIRREYDGYVVI